MAFPGDYLADDEEIVLDVHPHWWSFAPASAALAGALVLGGIVFAQGGGLVWTILRYLVGVGILVALAFFAVVFARWAGTSLVVTTQRVMTRHGAVRKSGLEIPLRQVQRVTHAQSLFERLIGSGVLHIESADGASQAFTDISRPGEVHDAIIEQRDAAVSPPGHRVATPGDAGASPGRSAEAASVASIPEQIGQLDRLRRTGAITEEEFQTTKAELLRRI